MFAASTRRIRSASAFAIGAENESDIGRIARDALRVLVDAVTPSARNVGRTLNASERAAEVATPVVAAIPLPDELDLRVGRQRHRAHASVTSGESGASRAAEPLLVAAGRGQPEPEAARAALVAVDEHHSQVRRSRQLQVVEDGDPLVAGDEPHADLLVDARGDAARVRGDRLRFRTARRAPG